MDRTLRGFVAGLGAGVLLNIYNLICFHLLGITRIRFIDWSGILLYRTRPDNPFLFTVAMFDQLMWDGALGIIFAYLLTAVSSRHYLLKGMLYGWVLGFVFGTIAQLFQLPLIGGIKHPNPANVVGILLWGLATAHFLKKLDQIYGDTSRV